MSSAAVVIGALRVNIKEEGCKTGFELQQKYKKLDFKACVQCLAFTFLSFICHKVHVLLDTNDADAVKLQWLEH